MAVTREYPMSAAEPHRRPPSRRTLLALLAVGWTALGPGREGRAQPVPPPPPPPGTTPATPAPPAPAPPAGGTSADRPGIPAPPDVVEGLRRTLARAIERFEARDLEGVLAYVSDAYWTGPLTKRTVRAQLVTMFQVNQQLRARVRIDEVRLVGPQAWVWSTGDVSGQLAFVNQWVGLFVWERELEIARREGGAWRLYGYQQ